MKKLIVFLQTNRSTRAVCNPGLTPWEAVDLCFKVPVTEFPICIKREAVGDVGVTLDWPCAQGIGREQLEKLFCALSEIKEVGR